MTSVVTVNEPTSLVTVQETDGTVEIPVAAPQVIEIGVLGPQGPPGEDSTVPGPPGASGGSYEHSQGSASDTWVIVHNLGYRPAGILVVDSAGTEWEGDPVHDSVNQLTIRFNAAFGGTAFLS